MRSIWNSTLRWAVCVTLLAGGGNLLAQTKSGRLCETLLPKTTQGFFAISNADLLNEQWNKTQLGHLMADPAMQPFSKDIRRQLEDRWSGIHEHFGIKLSDLNGVPGGDSAIGLIAPKPGTAAMAIVIDVTGKLPQAKELIEKATAIQLQRGAQRSEKKLDGCPDAVLQFDLPAPEDEREAAKSSADGRAPSDAAPRPTRNLFPLTPRRANRPFAGRSTV